MFVTSDLWPVPRKTDGFNFVGIADFGGHVKRGCDWVGIAHYASS